MSGPNPPFLSVDDFLQHGVYICSTIPMGADTECPICYLQYEREVDALAAELSAINLQTSGESAENNASTSSPAIARTDITAPSDAIKDNKFTQIIACKHHFHNSCLRTWLETPSNTCPACRRILYTLPQLPPVGEPESLRHVIRTQINDIPTRQGRFDYVRSQQANIQRFMRETFDLTLTHLEGRLARVRQAGPEIRGEDVERLQALRERVSVQRRFYDAEWGNEEWGVRLERLERGVAELGN